jgi:hypothetical protein
MHTSAMKRRDVRRIERRKQKLSLPSRQWLGADSKFPTLLVRPPWSNVAEAALNRLLTDTQLANDVTVAIGVGLLEVVEKAAALAHQH